MQTQILDLDESVGELPDSVRVPLRDWHDRLRFACSVSSLRGFARHLDRTLPEHHGPVFFGSGDFHHLSIALIERTLARHAGPLRVLVFDNHPDNMRFPLMVHCGSWISRAAALPGILQIDVVGITSSDISWAHAWENRLGPLVHGKLRYWSVGVETGWARRIGLGAAFRPFNSADTLLAALLEDLGSSQVPVYLSIDKDALDPVEAVSNWDQGVLRVAHLLAAIDALNGKLAASDVNGEVSSARYPQRWKRMLAAIDAQIEPPASSLQEWQVQQHQVNLALLPALCSAQMKPPCT